jgi:hypothetical protein
LPTPSQPKFPVAWKSSARTPPEKIVPAERAATDNSGFVPVIVSSLSYRERNCTTPPHHLFEITFVCAQLRYWIGSIRDAACPSACANANILWLWVVMTVDDPERSAVQDRNREMVVPPTL